MTSRPQAARGGASNRDASTTLPGIAGGIGGLLTAPMTAETPRGWIRN